MLDHYRTQLARALEYAGKTHTVEDVEQGVRDGKFQAWKGSKSIVITQIVKTPRLQELVFFLAAGTMEEMKILQPVILEWGRMQGCTKATFAGRRGWERSFLTKESGWIPTLVVFEKDLTNA